MADAVVARGDLELHNDPPGEPSDLPADRSNLRSMDDQLLEHERICSRPVRVQVSTQEDDAWLPSFWCGHGGLGCDVRRYELSRNHEDRGLKSWSRPTPNTCSGGSWEEAQHEAHLSSDSTTAAEGFDSARELDEVCVTPSDLEATSPSEDTMAKLASGEEVLQPTSAEPQVQEAPPRAWWDFCTQPAPEAKISVRPSAKTQEHFAVVPAPPSTMPDDASVKTQGGSKWAQVGFVATVGAVSAGALVTAACGALPVAIAAGSMGFTLGLLSSILGIRVGRWVS